MIVSFTDSKSNAFEGKHLDTASGKTLNRMSEKEKAKPLLCFSPVKSAKVSNSYRLIQFLQLIFQTIAFSHQK